MLKTKEADGIGQLLLFGSFNSVKQALLIILNIPFALIGGILALLIGHFNMSVSASVGFIALFGVAVLNGIVMVSYFNELRREGMNAELAASVHGPVDPIRPVRWTAAVSGGIRSFARVPPTQEIHPGLRAGGGVQRRVGDYTRHVGSVAALSVRHANKRFKGVGELARKMPCINSAAMLLIGLLVAAQGVRNVGL